MASGEGLWTELPARPAAQWLAALPTAMEGRGHATEAQDGGHGENHKRSMAVDLGSLWRGGLWLASIPILLPWEGDGRVVE